jgi:hypothetical protein
MGEDSPYPEVRSAVGNTDDPTMPASTLRVWVLGLMWAVVHPGVNQFFYFRYPAVTISSVSLIFLKFRLSSVISFQIDLSTSLELPHLQGMGSLLTQRYLLWHLSQSRTIHN